MAINKSFEELLNTQQKKLAFFQNLILVAVADGYLDESESNFLVTIGDQLGLTEEETQPIADNISVLSFIIPEDGLHKTLELQTLVLMMLQDGELEESEYKLCADYARRIGYSQDVLDEMIDQLKQGQL
ncbi:TerB family tellurite resistance protein [Rufibacter roseus]|uniref:TerB family tellurite resistance protein n=1 Tax=Rufibacter roseus TaxID=1567108 RepID=A0ABW2DKG1_9BACT|nr:TerB family tellurite resistance protein [Rufibacter roseus]